MPPHAAEDTSLELTDAVDFESPGTGIRVRPDFSANKLFEEHGRFIWRAVRHLGIAPADIPDVCQDVFLTVHRRLPDFEGRSSIRTWLYAICLRACAQYRRRAHRKHEQIQAEPISDLRADSSRTPDIQYQQRDQVIALLDQLDEDKRTVLVLFEIEGFAMHEVAEIVGCPLQTAYARLYAARKRLAGAIEARSDSSAPARAG